MDSVSPALNPVDLKGSALSDAEEDYIAGPPRGTRLAPVGADDDDDEGYDKDRTSSTDAEKDHLKAFFTAEPELDTEDLTLKIKQMESDQEELNSSLIAMTSHFAKVQFRLQQIVQAPAEQRESLLKELESFAFRGIPNVKSPKIETELTSSEEKNSEEGNEIISQDILELQRKKQNELINRLKGQLEELESYAYESGDGIVPSKMLLERQRIVMEQLKSRLNLNVDNIDKLSEAELKAQVDNAVRDIMNPLKMKSHLVNQLKTQITDLEMFIQFLQQESISEPCGCSKHSDNSTANKSRFRQRTKSEQEEIRAQTVTIMQRAMAVLQLAAVSQFGCSATTANSHFYKNTLKATSKANHYGDLRAKLEIAVDHILEACSRVECLTDTDCTSIDSSVEPEQFIDSPNVTQIVRREVAVAIRDLMQHGMLEKSKSGSVIPFLGCAAAPVGGKSSPAAVYNGCHAWSVILKYYDLKGGKDYNSAPNRKLSQSFGLDLESNSSNPKQTLLSTIGSILTSHIPYKRSFDAQFKAFVCEALNQRKLIPWLKLIVKNQQILETFYQPWSYVVKTGFDDAFRSLERLSIYGFKLPVNVAVKQFNAMNDAF